MYVLHGIELYCRVLYDIALHGMALQGTVRYLQIIIGYCIVLCWIALLWNCFAWYYLVLHLYGIGYCNIAWGRIVLHGIWGIVLYCTMLHYIRWYSKIFYGIAQYCIILDGSALFCIVLHVKLYSIAMYYMVSHGIKWYCMAMYEFDVYCMILHCIVLCCMVFHCDNRAEHFSNKFTNKILFNLK